MVSLGGTRGDSSRYVIQERLGAGSVAVVYRAHDRQRGMDVALKTLKLPSGAHLYRFKQEFRALADIVHPNLATLYGLEAHGDEWFITMELVDGVEFLDYVRPPADWTASPASAAQEMSDETAPLPRSPESFAPRKRGPLDVGKLRASLRQLADAVNHLHSAGKLHRDIKPSNVMVDHSGRVVLCDFGLVIERDRDQDATDQGFVVGTPTYMSPEQAMGAELDEASDWYSVGATLYEALTGRLPFAGNASDVIERKQIADPPPPSALDADMPGDLDALCMSLLRRNPADRPTGAAIRSALDSSVTSVETAATSGTWRLPFVGREAQLEMLRDALESTRRDDKCVAAFVRGSSGIGKSHLARRFITEAQQRRPDLLTLSGRCFESEQLRYKALDPIVDALSAHLATLDDDEIERLVPRDSAALCRLFPVLSRLDPFVRPLLRDDTPPDLLESRRRAFGALRFLLRQLASTCPVVLFIDDMQWGDADSAGFLTSLIHHPTAPALLLIGCFRGEDTAASPMLANLLRGDVAGIHGDIRYINLEPLRETAARQLATAVASATDLEPSAGRIADILRDARGNPMFVAELSRMSFTAAAEDSAPANLERLFQHRIEALPEPARALLSCLAVAARPLATATASQAADVLDPAAALAKLRAERLVRLRPSDGEETLEIYHDRIREAAVALLEPDEIARIHLRLATTLERDGDSDPDALVEHWLAAGNRARTAELALAAAANAETALAFHRAARYYELALELHPPDSESLPGLRSSYADALANAGRPEEAAEAYLAATPGVSTERALDIRQNAMIQYLRAGHADDGITIAQAILQELGGARIPRTRRRALAALVSGKVRIAVRGLRFVERQEDEVSPEELRRADIYYALAVCLGFDDPIVGAAMQTHHILHALRIGEVHRAAIALSFEMVYLSLAGTPAKAAKLLPSVMALAERIQDPSAVGMANISVGMGAFVSGQWRRANEYLAKGRATLDKHASSLRWEACMANTWQMATLVNLGELRELVRMLPILLREAEEQGNHHYASALRAWRSNLVWLVMDDPDEAWRQADLGRPLRRSSKRHPNDYYDFVTRMRIELYRGDGPAAWQRVEGVWGEIRQSMVQRFPNMSIETLFLRARAALAAAVSGHEPESMLRVAEACARKLAKSRLPWGVACAELVTACTLVLRREQERAIEQLLSAAVRFDGVDMGLLAAASRYLRGRLLGGDEGATIAADATRWMTDQAVADPTSLSNMCAPVFPAVG